MNIFFPDNIFARSIASYLTKEKQDKIGFFPSAVLSKKLNDNPDSLALIPTMEIITNQEFFISRSIGLSFDGILSNSYIYYGNEREHISKINLAGDVSSMEAIMCKILFKELYDTEVELNISIKIDGSTSQTHLVTGDANFNKGKYKSGVSFAEEVVDLISAPYVNYVLASNNEELLKSYTKRELSRIKEFDFSKSELISQLEEGSSNFITENSKNVIFDLEELDIAGLNEMIRLTFYHGVLKDLFDIKFV